MMEPSSCGAAAASDGYTRERDEGTEDRIPVGYSAKGTFSRVDFVVVDCRLNFPILGD
jgi:hypothetical protein